MVAVGRQGAEGFGAVGVPGGLAEDGFVHVDGDEAGALLDEIAGHEAALAEPGVAVLRAELRRFALKIEIGERRKAVLAVGYVARAGVAKLVREDNVGAGKAADVGKFRFPHRVKAGLEKLVAEIVEGRAVVMDAADEGEFVGMAGHAREEFGEFDAWNVGADGFPGTADVAGSIGFGIPGVDLGGAADEKQEDDGFGGLDRGTQKERGG